MAAIPTQGTQSTPEALLLSCREHLFPVLQGQDESIMGKRTALEALGSEALGSEALGAEGSSGIPQQPVMEVAAKPEQTNWAAGTTFDPTYQQAMAHIDAQQAVVTGLGVTGPAVIPPPGSGRYPAGSTLVEGLPKKKQKKDEFDENGEKKVKKPKKKKKAKLKGFKRTGLPRSWGTESTMGLVQSYLAENEMKLDESETDSARYGVWTAKTKVRM